MITHCDKSLDLGFRLSSSFLLRLCNEILPCPSGPLVAPVPGDARRPSGSSPAKQLPLLLRTLAYCYVQSTVKHHPSRTLNFASTFSTTSILCPVLPGLLGNPPISSWLKPLLAGPTASTTTRQTAGLHGLAQAPLVFLARNTHPEMSLPEPWPTVTPFPASKTGLSLVSLLQLPSPTVTS